MAVPIDQNRGYYFDDLSKIRVVEPDTANNTQELKENCKEFVDKISDFQNLVGGFIEMVDSLAKEVEREKLKAIGTRNKLKSIAKHREAEKQQLHSLIAEKKMELERLRIEYESLHLIEKEQEEFMEDFG